MLIAWACLKNRALCVLTSLLLGTLSLPAMADVWGYVDAKGVAHFAADWSGTAHDWRADRLWWWTDGTDRVDHGGSTLDWHRHGDPLQWLCGAWVAVAAIITGIGSSPELALCHGFVAQRLVCERPAAGARR